MIRSMHWEPWESVGYGWRTTLSVEITDRKGQKSVLQAVVTAPGCSNPQDLARIKSERIEEAYERLVEDL